MKRALALLVVLACDGSSGPNPGPGGPGDGATTSWNAAVGMGGTLVQTFDQRTWVSRSVLDADLYGVACVGNLDGWAVGANGTVAHTTNGGGAWSLQTSHLVATLRSVRFADALHGVIAGDNGALASTADGGTTWVPMVVTSSDLTGVAATEAGNVFVASAGGVLLLSTTYGASFTSLTVAGAGDFEAVAATAAGDLVLASDNLGNIFASSNGSAFRLETTAPSSIAALSVAGEWAGGGSWSAGTALAAGPGGTILRRAADGVWAGSPSGTRANLHAALVTSTLSYVAGDDGTLLALEGNAWAAIDTGTHAALNALDDL
jgi:photosystem II stability/assembly factor-like uncharacterized protein